MDIQLDYWRDDVYSNKITDEDAEVMSAYLERKILTNWICISDGNQTQNIADRNAAEARRGMRTTHILYLAAGSPSQQGITEGTCKVCGLPGAGLEFSAWVRQTFTDLDKLVAGDIICHACQFSFCERSDRLAQVVGKEKPQRMRNYSHIVTGGQWFPLSKAYKDRMTDLILNSTWDIAVIAQSGQKHLLFRATPGVLLFEEVHIPDIGGLNDSLDIVVELMETFSKAEIGSGRYLHHRILKFGLDRWNELESNVEHLRGTRIFELALFLAQKKETDIDGASRTSSEDAGHCLARDTELVQINISPNNLATIRGQHQRCGGHEQQPGKIHQLSLFEAQRNTGEKC